MLVNWYSSEKYFWYSPKIYFSQIFYLRDPTTLTLVWEMTPIRKLSKARVRKQANVETKATQRSRQAIPMPT